MEKDKRILMEQVQYIYDNHYSGVDEELLVRTTKRIIDNMDKLKIENNIIIVKIYKIEKYIKKWIEEAERNWCSDINDYIGISGLYNILELLESEE